MATLYTQQSSNVHKTWLLVSLFLVVVISLGWLFSYTLNQPAILYVAILFSLVMNIVSYWYSDKIALASVRAYEAPEADYVELHRIVENLAITAGLPKPRVYIIPDQALNAFATGRDKNHAAVAVTEGLLKILNKTELEGVIAHELSHIGNRDILLSTMVVVLVGFLSLLSHMFLRMSWLGGRDRDREGGGLLIILAIVSAIIAPLVGTLIQLAISRKREFLADASGALLTRYPEGLASALEKIQRSETPMLHASNATAHLFIANPFGGAGARIGKLFMTHPPVEDRVKALRELSV